MYVTMLRVFHLYAFVILNYVLRAIFFSVEGS